MENVIVAGIDLQKEKGIGPDVSALIATAKAYIVKTENDEKSAIEMAKVLKIALDDIDAREEDLIGPAKLWVRQVQGWSRPLKAHITDGINAVKVSIIEWRRQVAIAAQEVADKARREREKKEAAAAKAGKPAPFIPPPPVIQAANKSTTDSGASATGRKIRKFRIVDDKLIPREYLIADEKQIGALVRAGLESIPGIEIYEEDSLAIR